MEHYDWHSMEIPSNLPAIRDVEQVVLGHLKALGYSQDCMFAVKLALEEAVVNAMRHGNHMNPELPVRVKYDVSRRRVVVRVSDSGAGFDPSCVPDPTTDENIQRPYGRGLLLMRAYMDQVTFNPTGNEVTMVKFNERDGVLRPVEGKGSNGNSNSQTG